MQNKIRSKFLIIGLILVILLIMLFVYFFSSNFWALSNNPFNSTKLNILLVGYDSSINGTPRADTIILASIDLKTQEIGLLSIPRDTRVVIPGRGNNKINASHAFGGIDLTVKTVERFLDVPIDYYVETDFKGFGKIIDTIGGVDINIQESLHYVDDAGGLNINLSAGEQHLKGEEALEYVRFREPTMGDIGRVKRQQFFLKAVMKKVLNTDIVMKLPSIYNETKKAVNTNIPLQDITPFIRLFKGINLANLETIMVPGVPKYINGVSYWLYDKKELNIVINKLIRSKEYIKNSYYDLSILNGNGTPGQASEISFIMKKYGFNVINVGNAANFNNQNTRIIYFTKDNQEIAKNIKKVIGGQVVYQSLGPEKSKQTREDISIIIGKEYLR